MFGPHVRHPGGPNELNRQQANAGATIKRQIHQLHEAARLEQAGIRQIWPIHSHFRHAQQSLN